MQSDSGSKVYAYTITDSLHDWKECIGLANGTSGGKAKVIPHGELHAFFTMDNVKGWIIVERCYVMPSKNITH